ncbi:MAG: hypothetical protein IKH05_02835 [Bacteroidaceae bacterium]|nr:hypothetical protein [Bacteroidaceae bacterium]
MVQIMSLFYDESTRQFSLVKTETNECVFLTYSGQGKHIGWDEKDNLSKIIKNNVRIDIHTNFWPDKVSREWFRAEIKLNNILLRPISHCYDNGRFSRPCYTIQMTHENFNWDVFLGEICNICNHSEAWLYTELEKILVKLPQDSANIDEQIKVLKLLREYDSMNCYYVEKYRSHFDPILFDKEIVLPQIEKIFTQMEPSSLESVDVIWNYIKDYYQNIKT